ncbi:hypothetical protein B0T17DRAFT_615221 [Bombardia bombarda]|uniref:Uncharacterized protein n=1 Tax=Bombardia bombarda TaxID=252184 RepID=A0AA39X8U0_9PEZI|nr:hypothetical protein B0T17DRAFT_615221 [Bombardia bombarda]
MEVIRSMLACIFGHRSRDRHGGYTQLVDEKRPLYLDSSPYCPVAGMTYGTTGHTSTASSTPENKTAQGQQSPDAAAAAAAARAPAEVEVTAARVVQLLRDANPEDSMLELQQDIKSALGHHSWNRRLVEECFDNIIDCVEDGRSYMGGAMCEALDTATAAADKEFAFPRRHPQSVQGFIAIVAVGILAQMQGPWVLEVLGFGEIDGRMEGQYDTSMCALAPLNKVVLSLKPRPGSVAAWWISGYAPYIPNGSVQAYLCGLDMVHDLCQV